MSSRFPELEAFTRRHSRVPLRMHLVANLAVHTVRGVVVGVPAFVLALTIVLIAGLEPHPLAMWLPLALPIAYEWARMIVRVPVIVRTWRDAQPGNDTGPGPDSNPIPTTHEE